MAYTPLDLSNPVSSQVGTAVPASSLGNDLALSDAGMMLALKSFDFSIVNGTGSAKRPQFIYFKNGTRWLRGTITWGTSSGEKYNPTSILWELSTNSGSAYDSIGTQAITYDSSGNPTATSGAGGFGVMVLALLGHFWRYVDTVDAHIASSTAHSIGTIAAQAASAVAITGGSAKLALEKGIATALGSKSAAFNIDCSAANYFTLTVTGASAAATFINKPSSLDAWPFAIKIVNGGLATDLFPGATTPGNAALGLSSSGTDWVYGVIIDGSTVEITGKSLAMG